VIEIRLAEKTILDGVNTVPLSDPRRRLGAGHQNIKAVLEEVESGNSGAGLGIPISRRGRLITFFCRRASGTRPGTQSVPAIKRY
jgi:hypothetical protein